LPTIEQQELQASGGCKWSDDFFAPGGDWDLQTQVWFWQSGKLHEIDRSSRFVFTTPFGTQFRWGTFHIVGVALSATNVFELHDTVGIEASPNDEERRNWKWEYKLKSPPFARSREEWGIRTKRKVKDNAATTI